MSNLSVESRLRMRFRRSAMTVLSTAALLSFVATTAAEPKPVPRMQAVPLPHDEISFQRDGGDEAGCFRKPARWCDYSGPVTATVNEGITLMDHPMNLNHPVPFHVRDDGWMGAALTFPGAHAIRPGEPLQLRYGLYVHGGIPPLAELQARWEEFAKTTFEDFPRKK